jgi:hypothetical protein
MNARVIDVRPYNAHSDIYHYKIYKERLTLFGNKCYLGIKSGTKLAPLNIKHRG